MILHENKVLASICRESFYDFVVEFWSTIVAEEPVFNWHIEYLCNQLQEAAERVFAGEPKKHDLVINIPPGTSKSTIISQMFPAWVWTRMASAKFLCASYAHEVALKDSVRTRDIVQSELFQSCFPEIQLREDENMKGLFTNTQTGWRLAVGTGGVVTGYHGHFLIVDDPLNPEQSYSEAELRSTNRWMQTTFPSRKIDKQVSVMILVQQRLHQADPSGEMLEKSKKPGGTPIHHICLPGEIPEEGGEKILISPARLQENYEDGLLDPIRMPREVLEGLRVDLGSYGYASQILQTPIPLGGGLFQCDKLILEPHPPKKILRSVRSWDKAGTKGGGNWSVGVKMVVDDHNEFWVVHVIRGQWGAREREDNISATADTDGATPQILEIEGGSGGKESGENTTRNLAGHRVITYHPTGDKEARAYPFASQVGGGLVHVLIAEWTQTYIDELRYFPFGKYDDQVDASSGAFNYLARKKTRIGGF